MIDPNREQRRVSREVAAYLAHNGQCCDMHNVRCEQGGEECCAYCTEILHFWLGHGGVPCVLDSGGTAKASM